MMGPESMACLMESMWGDLPAAVLEKIFTFLPIASLSKFRTLSRKWNRLITSPTFKHARASEEYALITPRWGRLEGGWDVLDVARKRCFTLSDAFLTKHVQRQGLAAAAGARKRFRRTYLAATDGGLFCVRYFFTKRTSGLFVCNPVLKTVKQLPHAAGLGWGEFAQTVVMATDIASREYEIFLVNTPMYYTAGETFDPESILVYESKTSRWRTAPYRPFNLQIWWGSLTIFNNNQYCIVNRGDSSREGLVSYDKNTGVVSDLRGIDFPSAPRSHLVVSNARLFCVIPVDHPREDFPSVEIFEIDVVKRESTRVTEMPHALLVWVLGHDLERGFCEMESKIKVATGSADAILIATVVGRCAAYSLSRKSWYQYPDDRTLLEEYCRGDMTREEVYGRSYCLSLCAP